jgi:hypothetical protein
MSSRRSYEKGAAPSFDGGAPVSRIEGDFRKDRLHGLLLATLVVLVQVAWGGVLVYLGVRYL